jgi:hypothetical protein
MNAQDIIARMQRSALHAAGIKPDLALASTILASGGLSNALTGLKFVAMAKGKPVVRATLVSLIDAALED